MFMIRMASAATRSVETCYDALRRRSLEGRRRRLCCSYLIDRKLLKLSHSILVRSLCEITKRSQIIEENQGIS